MTGNHTLAVTNLHRAAAAVRLHVENSVLREPGLTWTAFVVLRVVWRRGETETRLVAAEAGISKGTLTGVVKTLETRGLIGRTRHATDGRLVLLSLTARGKRLMDRLLPDFNTEELFVTKSLNAAERRTLAGLLGKIITHVETHGGTRRTELRRGG